MRFLADECCDFSVVKALQTAGYDVLCVSDIMPRANDLEVIERAVPEKRIVLTEDKDFGQLIYASMILLEKYSSSLILLFKNKPKLNFSTHHFEYFIPPFQLRW